MKNALALLLIVLPIVLAIWFRIYIEIPAITPLADRAPKVMYGEMYGPVTFFRYYIYGVCLFISLCGIAVALLGKPKQP